MIKSPSEISSIKKASQISSQAITRVISAARSFKNESEIVTLFKQHVLSTDQIEKLAYLPICSTGPRNSILHYVSNNHSIASNSKDLVLLDIGCKYQNYCSDITRTFPRSGRFTPAQKKIYQIVLDVQKYAISRLCHDGDWLKISRDVCLRIYQSLLELGLVYPVATHREQSQLVNLFMPHSLGHTIGLEVHDTNPSGGLKTLKKNMVVTVEPGIYFASHLLFTTPANKNLNYSEIKKYQKIGGVRIEDTVLITQKGCRVLSDAPKEIVDIENLIKA